MFLLFIFRAWGGFCLVERFTSSTTSGGNLSFSSESWTQSYPTLWRLTGWETPADTVTEYTCRATVRGTLTPISVNLATTAVTVSFCYKSSFYYKFCFSVSVVEISPGQVCCRAGLGPFRWSSRLVSLNTCYSAVIAAQMDTCCTGEDRRHNTTSVSFFITSSCLWRSERRWYFYLLTRCWHMMENKPPMW